ncbi:hypothetical protein DB741_10735 [Edwardsiella ictaluri]|nr:hypothetical protein [Edwardsiella ictaluri]EKS7764061.1 hypothetical protein [Edwardsiella ictaluri]EKS7770885.1 hypothetical protein [Edwardsiella ictaluri]EKS7774029.1 hypothetical protein [Edwardsiella ictaluri]EKS7777354.1 hypothetical protein [Edwardsiella ictaluri]EKS7787485.1 hypothetical protein [Edwardsiella ictaluri]
MPSFSAMKTPLPGGMNIPRAFAAQRARQRRGGNVSVAIMLINVKKYAMVHKKRANNLHFI